MEKVLLANDERLQAKVEGLASELGAVSAELAAIKELLLLRQGDINMQQQQQQQQLLPSPSHSLAPGGFGCDGVFSENPLLRRSRPQGQPAVARLSPAGAAPAPTATTSTTSTIATTLTSASAPAEERASRYDEELRRTVERRPPTPSAQRR